MAEKRIFITGGASGLGLAMARRWAVDGWRVCVGDVHEARGAEAGRELAASGRDAFFVRCDVTREEDLEAARDAIVERWGGVDVVVNNAGVAQAGAIDEVSLDDWAWILDINLMGVVRGCRVFTPVFKRQKSGWFVNVASMAGLMNVPSMSSYNASKAAVVSLSETLRMELAPHGIGVSVVCPSFFKTNLAETMRAADPRLLALTRHLLERGPITAEQVAEYVFRAVGKREMHVLPHAEGRQAWRLKRLLPWNLFARLMERQTRVFLGTQDR